MMNKPMIGVALVVMASGIGLAYYLHNRSAPAPRTAAAVQPPPLAPAEPAIQHPVPPADAVPSKGPLPALADSDAAVRNAFADVAGAATVTQFLLPENIVRHIVVTVDNLARSKVAVDKRPIAPVAGSFMVDGDELHATLNPQNFERYQPLVELIGGLDMQRLASLYLRYYPLFQQAYQDLGYPNGYFNDRLVAVIDVLLATPQPAAPLELIRPNVMYAYADPSLEARPAGQKLLIRMGPGNAAAIKAKLSELRAIITAAPPRH